MFHEFADELVFFHQPVAAADGRGFVFGNWADKDGLWSATCRALETYYSADGLENLIRNDMFYDSSWNRAAKNYLALYRKLY